MFFYGLVLGWGGVDRRVGPTTTIIRVIPHLRREVCLIFGIENLNYHILVTVRPMHRGGVHGGCKGEGGAVHIREARLDKLKQVR